MTVLGKLEIPVRAGMNVVVGRHPLVIASAKFEPSGEACVFIDGLTYEEAKAVLHAAGSLLGVDEVPK